jgi:hypothetical protein
VTRAPGPPLAATDPARLVGRWEGEVDLTFPDRTLIVHGVSRRNDGWVAQIEYGTTGLYLNSLAGVVDLTGDQITLRFVTSLAGLRRDDRWRIIRRSSYAELVRQVTAKRDELLSRRRVRQE